MKKIFVHYLGADESVRVLTSVWWVRFEKKKLTCASLMENAEIFYQPHHIFTLKSMLWLVLGLLTYLQGSGVRKALMGSLQK